MHWTKPVLDIMVHHSYAIASEFASCTSHSDHHVTAHTQASSDSVVLVVALSTQPTRQIPGCYCLLSVNQPKLPARLPNLVRLFTILHQQTRSAHQSKPTAEIAAAENDTFILLSTPPKEHLVRRVLRVTILRVRCNQVRCYPAPV